MEFIDIPIPVKTDKPSDASLSLEMLHSTADFLKKMSNSDGYVLYLLEETLGELYISAAESKERDYSSSRNRWNIEHSETIAVYAFKNNISVMVDSNNSLDLNFPYFQAISSLYPRYIISLPLIDFQKRCFGVVEYYRNDGEQYEEVDLKLCQFLLQNCAEAFTQNENAIFLAKSSKVQLNLQNLLEVYTFRDENEGSYSFPHQVVLMARDCTKAMLSSFFLEKQGDLIRIADTAEDLSCQQEEAQQNGFGTVVIRSEASVNFQTTLMNRTIHGILKVCNKIGNLQFSLLDKQILHSFVQMCTLWCAIEYMSGYLKKQRSLNENILGLINMQLENAGDFDKKLRVLETEDLKMLNSLESYCSTSIEEKELSRHVVKMISHIKGQLPIPDEALRDFVVMVAQCHQNGEEVDYRHTVLCVQGLYRLLEGCKSVTSDKEALAMMIASLSYNIAVNNSSTAKSAIFGRYNLYANELIRFEVIQFLLQESKLLCQWNLDDQNQMLSVIKEFLIDMNLQCFKLNIARFSKLVQNKDFNKLEPQENLELRSLIQSILPGIGNMLGHFRSQEFRENFPNFSLLQHLEQRNLTCVDIILAICPI